MDGGGEPSHERTDVGVEDFKPEMLLRNKDTIVAFEIPRSCLVEKNCVSST